MSRKSKIAAAKKWSEKLSWAFDGRAPYDPVEKLVFEAFSLAPILLDKNLTRAHKRLLPEWTEDLKRTFADLLFPALLEDRPDEFFKVVKAMAEQRANFAGKSKTRPDWLRCAILSASPEELLD